MFFSFNSGVSVETSYTNLFGGNLNKIVKNSIFDFFDFFQNSQRPTSFQFFAEFAWAELNGHRMRHIGGQLVQFFILDRLARCSALYLLAVPDLMPHFWKLPLEKKQKKQNKNFKFALYELKRSFRSFWVA